MKHSSYFFLIVTLFINMFSVEAQIWDKLKKKAEEKIEKVLKNEPDTNDSNSSEGETTQEAPTELNVNNNDGVAVWRNYKFVPGEKVIFFDDLKSEEVGEFPSRWDLKKGGAEVATFNGEKVIIGTAEHDNTILPLFKTKDYLSDEFTIEFDIYIDELSEENNNSWVNYNIYLTEKVLNGSTGYGDVRLKIRKGKTKGQVCTYDFQIEEVPLAPLKAWHHIAMSYYKGKFKLFYDEKRIVNLPNLSVTPDMFAIQMDAHTNESYMNRKLNYAVKNIRIAHGGGQLYKRIVAEGKYSTNGILFDSGKAMIKPQSMGIINKIVNVMKEYADWNFQVIGHTDTDGDQASNLALSTKRAEAIKTAIVAQGISDERITTLGKGQSEPIANNTTKEGKANNRRVEFIKQ